MKSSALFLSLAFIPAAAATAHAAEPREVVVEAATLEALAPRLVRFSRSLEGGERAAWIALVQRAASVPLEDPRNVAVPAVFADVTAEPLVLDQLGLATGVIVEGKDRRPTPGGIKETGVVEDDPRGLIGPKPEDPHSLIGPKPEDPRSLIGPKPEDPRALGRRLVKLLDGLSFEERVVFDWLVARAVRAESPRTGTPGGLPPGASISLGQALGVVAIGPKQDDPAPRPQARRFRVIVTELEVTR